MTFTDWILPPEYIGTTDDGRARYRLRAPLLFGGEPTSGLGLRVCVPEGFVTDFASVPRPLWPIFPPTGIYDRAAVVHDYLCSQDTCGRFMADAVFREAMRELGVPWWRRVAMYWGVRLCSMYMRVRSMARGLR